jgi:putative ABC transport system permease protein
MFRNYLKVALRNLWKSKAFSAINILGLAVGLATCLLILLYVVDELSYDRYNEKADRIYRVNCDIKFGGGDLHLTVASDPMGPTLKKDYPQVEEFTRIYASQGAKLIKKGNEYINEPDVAHVDSTFFNVFTLPSLEGDTRTALNEPNTVVITESAAKKYFGTTHALGKVIEADKTAYKVTAVIKDIPRNSHFNLDFLFSMDNVEYGWNNFLSNNFQTYVVLKAGTDYKVFEKNFKNVIAKYVLPQAKQLMHINSMEDFEKAGNKLEYTLMPLKDIHLRSDRFPELSTNGNIQYVYIFSAVALFVMLIACINFMNLSTARSASRAKEVGIRKVLGTERKTLIMQFLVESTLTVFIAFLIAIGIASLVLPLFNDLAAKSLSIKSLLSREVLPVLIAFPFIVGALAGSYPALFLSRFQPVVVLKGNVNTGLKKSHLRSVLVVFQFATSIVLIISTIVVYRQLHYIQTKNLGFNKDQILIINGTYALGNNADAFKNEVLNMPGVSMGTFSSFLPVSSSRNDNTFSKDPVMDSKNGTDMQIWTIDYDYLKTMGMQIVRGRNFSKEFGSDSSAVLINETTAKVFGFDNPIGKKIYTFDDNLKTISYTVVGVVKNFHFESLRQQIGPLCMVLGKNIGLASFKVNAASIPALLKNIESRWKALAPGMPFSYQFMDDSFDNMYRAEQRVGTIAMIFSALAILIACLGLFGLSAFTAEQRTKEIGIRKVLGASVQGIVQLLSKDFIRLVLIAFIIAAPLAWYFMNKWLQDFSYRVNLNGWVFLGAGSIALLIALLTISFQAIKAALANPVKNLRTE